MTAPVADLMALLGDWKDPAASWRDEALCAEVDSELFFPEKGGSTRDAKKVCTGCEVRQQCLDFAVDNEERFGIWGGMSERERRRLSRTRTVARPSKGERTAADVRRLHARSMPAEQIAAHLGVSLETVYRTLRADRAPEPAPAAPVVVELPRPEPRAPRPWTTAEAREAIRTLTAHGMSAAEIGRELGISDRTVQRIRSQQRTRRGAA